MQSTNSIEYRRARVDPAVPVHPSSNAKASIVLCISLAQLPAARREVLGRAPLWLGERASQLGATPEDHQAMLYRMMCPMPMHTRGIKSLDS